MLSLLKRIDGLLAVNYMPLVNGSMKLRTPVIWGRIEKDGSVSKVDPSEVSFEEIKPKDGRAGSIRPYFEGGDECCITHAGLTDDNGNNQGFCYIYPGFRPGLTHVLSREGFDNLRRGCESAKIDVLDPLNRELMWKHGEFHDEYLIPVSILPSSLPNAQSSFIRYPESPDECSFIERICERLIGRCHFDFTVTDTYAEFRNKLPSRACLDLVVLGKIYPLSGDSCMLECQIPQVTISGSTEHVIMFLKNGHGLPFCFRGGKPWSFYDYCIFFRVLLCAYFFDSDSGSGSVDENAFSKTVEIVFESKLPLINDGHICHYYKINNPSFQGIVRITRFIHDPERIDSDISWSMALVAHEAGNDLSVQNSMRRSRRNMAYANQKGNGAEASVEEERQSQPE